MRFSLSFYFFLCCLLGHAQSSIGILSASETDNNGIICFGENFSLNVLGNSIMPNDLSIPLINYNPGVGIAIFAAAPTYLNNELLTEPTLLGIVQSQPYNVFLSPFVFDYNALIASIPPPLNNLITPVTLYFQAVTLYDHSINLPYVNNPGNPIDAAQSNVIALTLQPEIVVTTNQDCVNNWTEVNVNQAGMGATVFDISNSFPTGCTFPATINNQSSSNITNFSGNNIPFGFAVSNSDGCTTNINETFIGTYSANINPISNVCEGDAPLTLTAVPSGGTWSGNPTVISGNIFTPSAINISTTTDYILTYTPAVPAGGCALPSTITITVVPDANSQFTVPTEMCINDEPVQLQSGVSGGIWSAPNNSVNMQGIFDPEISGAGTQTILYSVGGNCPTFTTHDIIVYPKPVVRFDASATEGCLPLSVDFTNTTAGTTSDFVWSVNGSVASTGSATFNFVFENNLCHTVGLALTDDHGCSNVMDSINVICPFADPVVDFEYTPENPTLADFEIQFNETLGNTSVNFWDFGDGQSSFDWAPAHYYDVVVPSEFQVCLTGYDFNGCDATACRYIQLASGFELYCPTAFTPGNDGLNDGFRPVMVSKKEIYKYRMTIYNRNGEQIYESENPQQAWYGNNDKGDVYVTDGAYTWVVEVTLEGLSEKKIFKGSVLIVR
jgi:gliding motility-associated-like protein